MLRKFVCSRFTIFVGFPSFIPPVPSLPAAIYLLGRRCLNKDVHALLLKVLGANCDGFGGKNATKTHVNLSFPNLQGFFSIGNTWGFVNLSHFITFGIAALVQTGWRPPDPLTKYRGVFHRHRWWRKLQSTRCWHSASKCVFSIFIF